MQKIAIWAPSHNFVGLYIRNEGTYRESVKKHVKQQYLLHMTLQYGELRPTSGCDRFDFVSLGRPSKFQRVSRLGFVTAATSLNGSQPNFAGCLAVSCAAKLYIHFWRLLPRNRILSGVKFSLRPPSHGSPIGSVTARHSSSGREPNFEALSTGRHLYSAGRPSRWALSHILVSVYFTAAAYLTATLCSFLSNLYFSKAAAVAYTGSLVAAT